MEIVNISRRSIFADLKVIQTLLILGQDTIKPSKVICFDIAVRAHRDHERHRSALGLHASAFLIFDYSGNARANNVDPNG